MDRTKLKDDLLTNYHRHKADTQMRPVFDAIERDLFPLYDRSPFITHRPEFLLQKLRFVDEVFQLCYGIEEDISEASLSLGVAYYEFALVEREFHSFFELPNLGLRSEKSIREKYNFKRNSRDAFHRRNWLEALPQVDTVRVPATEPNDNVYSPYIKDMLMLAIPYMALDYDEIIESYRKDISLDRDMEVSAFDAAKYIRTKYMNYTIINPILQVEPIRHKLSVFRTYLDNITE